MIFEFQYRVIELLSSDLIDGGEYVLNSLGGASWELVSVIRTDEHVFFYLKRSIEKRW